MHLPERHFTPPDSLASPYRTKEAKINDCPICQGEMDDTRHVGVECFYAVDEVAPNAEKRPIFREVDADGGYWGTTRRYPAGTKDKHRIVEIRAVESKVETDQVPVPPIRLIELSLYSVTCCKSCRADSRNVRQVGQGRAASAQRR